MTKSYLSFTVDNALYAINAIRVLEVLEKQIITNIPNAPQVIKGVVHFRGEFVPVFDTRSKFNLPPRNENDSFTIIIIDLSHENEIYKVSAIVDNVKEVITVNESEIKAVPPMSKEFNAEYIEGIVKVNNDFIILLDVEKIFTSSEICNIIQPGS